MQDPNTKNDRKAYGNRVKTVREGLQMDRHAFAELIGVAYKTLQHVELGYQALGDEAKAIVERLEAGESPQEMREMATPYGTPADTLRRRILSLVADVATRDDFTRKAAEVARILGCDTKAAARKILEMEIEKMEETLR